MNRSRSINGAAAIALWASLTAAVLSAPACAAPVTIIDNGSPANRVDIVFFGDGYTQADLDDGLYDQHIQAWLDYTFTSGGFLADPFPRYKSFFNVHKITSVSNESEADIPSQSIFRDTALDATYDTEGVARYLTISPSKAAMIRDAELAGTGITADVQLVTVNHSKYGGGTIDGWAVFPGANAVANEMALHEMGHSFPHLTDEYFTLAENYPGPEPAARNATKNSAGQKWAHWLGFVDPRDATVNIGAYEGAVGYEFGVYRPSFSSKMRALNRPFDAVSREAFIHDIYQHVDPLDDWLENGSNVSDAALWVDVVDPDVIRLQWYIDDVPVAGATGSQFHARDFGYGPGNYSVRVRAYDEILDHSFAGGLLDLARTGLGELEQTVTWSLTVSPSVPGDYSGDLVVDSLDYDLWRRTFGSTELLAADGNSDGIVDAADYVVWRYHSAAADLAAGGPIPEAATSTLAIAALLICGACRPARLMVVSPGPALQV